MKILHLTTYLQGGAGRTIHDLILHQKKEGHTVSLVTSDTEYPGYCNYPEFLESFAKHDIASLKIDSLFKRDHLSNKRVVDKIIPLIIDQSVDIIHCHSATPSKIALEAKEQTGSRAPIIQSMQGWGQNKTPAQEQADVEIMNRIDVVIPVSKNSLLLLKEKGVYSERMQVVYNSVGPPSSKTLSQVDHAFFDSLKTSREPQKIIGCIGSICARKNQALLIEAMRMLSLKRKNLHCIFIGEGEALPLLSSLCQQAGIQENITFLGYKTQADAFIPYFDLLVLPSLAEGLPLTVLEGFRDEALVIGSDIPEIAEIIRNGENGFLFESNNPDALRETIETTLTLSNEELSTVKGKARNDYETTFAFESMASRYESIYNELVSSY